MVRTQTKLKLNFAGHANLCLQKAGLALQQLLSKSRSGRCCSALIEQHFLTTLLCVWLPVQITEVQVPAADNGGPSASPAPTPNPGAQNDGEYSGKALDACNAVSVLVLKSIQVWAVPKQRN
jgi:hypothetical protein